MKLPAPKAPVEIQFFKFQNVANTGYLKDAKIFPKVLSAAHAGGTRFSFACRYRLL
jgi:hypothetical protein